MTSSRPRIARALLLLALLALPACSWRNVIVLVYVWDPSPSGAPQLPKVLTQADGAVLEGRPVAECPGAVEYFKPDTNTPLLIAKVHVATSRVELASSTMSVDSYELVTLSDGLNLPSGAIDEDILQRADLSRALRSSAGFVRDLSSHDEFRNLLPSFVGKIVKGSNLATDVKEYCGAVRP